MVVMIDPAPLRGEVEAMPSKSVAHRALICAAFADRDCNVLLSRTSEDMEVTAECLRAMGAAIDTIYDSESGEMAGFRVRPVSRAPDTATLDCGESGSTLRFLIPVAAAVVGKARFTGRGRLPERPLGPLLDELKYHGSMVTPLGGAADEKIPLEITKLVSGGTFSLPGDVSSQFVSGILLAAPLIEGGAEIKFTSPVESVGYIDMTIDVMKSFGVDVKKTETGYIVPPGQRYIAPEVGSFRVEGDWSNAAFWLVAGALSGPVTCRGLREDSVQGDREILPLLAKAGAEIRADGDCVTVSKGKLRGMDTDVSDIPDAAPILSVLNAVSEGTSHIYNAGRLRIKESDRLAAVTEILSALGADVTCGADDLTIRGRAFLSGGETDSHNDHRIAMSAAVAAVMCKGSVTVKGAEAVNKSYPDFWEDYKKLGGKTHVVDLRR